MPASFDISGFVETVTTLKNNLPLALKAAGVAVLTLAQLSIAHGGNGWAPFKKLPKHPHQLLWDTGTLMRSLTVGDSLNVLEQSGNSVTVGTNVVYAAAQNFGYSPRNLPARPFLVYNQAVQEEAVRAFKARLLRGIE